MDRGPPHTYPTLTSIWADITTMHDSNVITSTPTGSTVYVAAAHAPMIHSNMLAIMTVPSCPLSLSFQLTVVPTADKLKITLCLEARNTK